MDMEFTFIARPLHSPQITTSSETITFTISTVPVECVQAYSFGVARTTLRTTTLLPAIQTPLFPAFKSSHRAIRQFTTTPLLITPVTGLILVGVRPER